VRGLAGSGGFASVYEGFDPRLDARVAIKVLADNWSNDPDIRRRFRQEAVLLRRLQTEQGVPGLVEVFDVDETATGQPFFVMGWAGGGTLASRAAKRPWSGQKLIPVIVALTQSLGHLHANGVVHRDIKPQNLLLRSDREVEPNTDELIATSERLVVGDFGLAKDMTVDASTLSFVGGTERYMAPEQLVFGGPVDHRADVYAATAMISELLSGRGQQTVAPQIQEVLQRGMMTEPDDRYASMADWQAALLTAIESAKYYQPEPETKRGPQVVGQAVTESTSGSTSAPSVVGFDAADPPTEWPAAVASPQPVSSAQAAEPATHVSGPSQPADAAISSPTGSNRSPLLMLGAIGAAIAAAVVAFFIFSGSSDPIVGPTTIESGQTATFSIDDESATTIVWTDPSGQRVNAPTLDITGRLPGQLTFSAVVDGEVLTRSVNVEESAAGPQIIGPQVLPQGSEAIYRADVPEGHSFFWIHPTRGTVNGDSLPVEQVGEQFVVGIVSVDPSGIERGDQMLVTSN